jgi:hypothetical protein
MTRTVKAGALSFEDTLALSAAGLAAPGHGILDIIKRELGLESVQHASIHVKHGRITPTILHNALSNFRPPAAEDAPQSSADDLAALTARVRAATELLRAAMETTTAPVREPASVIRPDAPDIEQD